MVTRRAAGLVGLAAVAVAAATLVAVELGLGAAGYGAFEPDDPCTAEVSFPGEGIDAAVQRIGLSGLNGAACELETTREELVLAFVPEAGGARIEWDRPTIERAVRAGLLRAVDDAERRGSIGSVTALVLREVVERAPIDWLLRGGDAIGGLVSDGKSLAESVRDRLAQAIENARESGTLGRLEALALEQAVELAPVDWLIRQAERLAALLD